MDILTDSVTDDIVIRNGDFVIGTDNEIDNQQSYFIVNSTPNYFKQLPFYSLNLQNYINGNISINIIKRSIGKLLEQDGFNRVDVSVQNGEIQVVAERI